MTRYDIHAPLHSEIVVLVDNFEECCRQCSENHPPSAPPAPPAPPGTPPPPPLSPAPPPMIAPNYPPLVPDGTGQVSVYDPYPAGASTTATGPCKGIVFQKVTVLGVEKYNCILRQSGPLEIWPGTTDAGGNAVVDPNLPSGAGDFVFIQASPPPPPMIPQGEACRPFFNTPYADMEPFGARDAKFPVTYYATDVLSPFECCARCSQSADCRGFVIRYADKACFLKTNNDPGRVGHSLLYATWTFYDPPSPPQTPPPTSPPPLSPPPTTPPPQTPPPTTPPPQTPPQTPPPGVPPGAPPSAPPFPATGDWDDQFVTQTGQCLGDAASNALLYDTGVGRINQFGPSTFGLVLKDGETVYDKCFNDCVTTPDCNAVQVRWPELYCVLYSMTVIATNTSAADAGEYRCYLRVHSPVAPPTAASPRPHFPPMPPKPDGTMYDNYTAVIAEAMDVPITVSESATEAAILAQAGVIVADRITVLIDAMAAENLNISSGAISGELIMVTSSTTRRRSMRSMRSRRLQTSGGTSIAGLDTSACNSTFADSAVFGVVLTVAAASLAERDAILAFMSTYDSSDGTTADATGSGGETATVCTPALVTALLRDLVDAPPPPPQAESLSIEGIIAFSAVVGALVLMCMTYTGYVLCKGGARPQQPGKKKSARDREAQEELRSLRGNAPVATSAANYQRFRDSRGAYNSQRMRVVPSNSQPGAFTFQSIRGQAHL